MTEVTTDKTADELSRLLDELNAGNCPLTDDAEAAELLAVARLIKTSAPPVPVPQQLVDQTVDKILASMPAKTQPSRRPWLYYGAAGAAAALLLAFGLHVFPGKQVLPLAAPPVTVAQNTVPEKSTANLPPPPPIPSQSVPTGSTAGEPPAAKTAGSGEVRTQPVNPPPAVLPQKEEKVPVKAAKSPVSGARAPMADVAPARRSAAAPAELQKLVAIPPVLSLPGQVPDSIRTDTAKGTITQVFAKDTANEVIITQRLASTDPALTKAPAAAADAAAEKSAVSRVTVSIHGQEVTIEGRQSREELLALAKSLTP